MTLPKPLPAASDQIIDPLDRKTQALEEQNRLLLQLLEQGRHADSSPPDRTLDERLARLERLEARLAEWDDETQGWFQRNQKRRRKYATPVVNVYNTPRGVVEPARPPWGLLVVLLIVGAVAVVWIGYTTTGENTPAHYNNHTGLYQQ